MGNKIKIIGIINVTDNSFSGDGLLEISEIVEKAKLFEREGADIIDIGGQSTRPGSSSISIEEEIERVVPAINAIKKEVNLPISVDSYKPEVVEEAIKEGASIINDIYGLAQSEMREISARYNLPTIIMHIKGTPQDMQDNPQYENVVEEIINYFKERIKLATSSGVKEDKIIIDPGIGFGKKFEHNLEILRNISEFKKLNKQVLVGVSRKSFLGQILNAPPQERLEGNLAVAVYCAMQGVDIVRVHEVKETKRALSVIEALIS